MSDSWLTHAFWRVRLAAIGPVFGRWSDMANSEPDSNERDRDWMS